MSVCAPGDMGRRRERPHVGRPRPAQAGAARDQDAAEAGAEAVPGPRGQGAAAEGTPGQEVRMRVYTFIIFFIRKCNKMRPEPTLKKED